MAKGIMLAYFVMITVIYPFYAPGGYLEIGEVKYIFFRNITLVTIAVMLVFLLISALRSRRKGWITALYRSMSIADWFACGYLLVIMLSYIFSDYKADALWGADGWHMGAMSQLMFVLLYFLMSRYLPCEGRWMSVWLTASGAVFLLGILNRYSVYPITMKGQTETFISTLGNINWYCGYWSVAAPIGMTLYWGCRSGAARIAWGVFTVTAILAGVTQGSDSAYLVFAVVYALLLLLSVGNRQRIYRFLELCMLFAVSCQVGRIMCYIPGLSYNYGNDVYSRGSRIADLLLDGNAALWLLAVAVVIYAVFRVTEGRRQAFSEKLTSKTVGIILAATMFVLAAGCLLSSNMLYGEGGQYTYSWENEVFRPDWGNGRGAAWNCGISAYRSMDVLHKAVGVGPDCFADYVYAVPQLAERLLVQFENQKLTCAHNEWLTILVNTGVLGLLCYVGLLASAAVRCLKKAGEQPAMGGQTGDDTQLLLYACVISLLAYTTHNMVSFQQILNTPYFFIVMGMGEGLVRRTEQKS